VLQGAQDTANVSDSIFSRGSWLIVQELGDA